MNEDLLRPVRGMREFGPDEALVRRKLLMLFEREIQKLGFLPVELPRLESWELMNLHITTDQGESVAAAGDNQKLIFPVLKRGEKYKESLKAVKGGSEESLADAGLIFDQTLSLLRYHVNKHGKGKGDTPRELFRYYQIGDVWRAERPQDGRYRQFKQIDMDIIYGSDRFRDHPKERGQLLGDLIGNIKTMFRGMFGDMLWDIGATDNTYVYWNSTKLSKARFEKAEVPKDKYVAVAKALDKYHKDGRDKVRKELQDMGGTWKPIEILLDDSYETKLAELENDEIYSSSGNLRKYFAEKGYDPFLLRGMNYYSGYMFELRDNDTQIALGGGGSYDGLTEKLFGAKWGGVGFSFGFERIYDMLVNVLGVEKLSKRLPEFEPTKPEPPKNEVKESEG